MERGCFLVFTLIIASCFYGSNAQTRVCTQEAVADIVFLVDGSWSIGNDNFEQIRQFLFTLVNSFDIGPEHVRIGLVQYSTTARTEFLLNTYQNKGDILQTIRALPYKGGGTKTGLGLDFLLTRHFVESAGSRASANVPQIAVVITDGQSQDNVEQHAQDLRSRGITLYAIGIKDADEDELRKIASDPKDQHVYSVSDFAALQGISQSIVHTLCTTVEEAKRQLSITLKECAQATVADIVFLVDGSSSIGLDNFQEIRQFLRGFIEGLDIGADKIRIGLAQFSSGPRQEFLLKDHMDKRSLLAQVDSLPYLTGGTATGKAISFLQTQYFTTEAGSRRDQRVPQIAIVITDGDSEDDVIVPAQQLRKHGVIMFAIGVGAANKVELQSIANRPSERFLSMIDNYQALQRMTQRLLQTVCVSMEDQRLALTQRFADIFFLVDSNMAPTDFAQVRNLLVRLTNQLNVGENGYRLGLAQFGQEIKVEFLLSAFRTKNETQIGVRRFRQRRVQANEPRNLASALSYARTNIFTTEAGSRQDKGYRQFLVVVSGGDSTDDVSRASYLIKSEGITVTGVGLGSSSLKQMKIISTAPYIYQTTNIAPILKTVFETEYEKSDVSDDCKTAKLADIVFIVDESGSIGTANFQLVRGFLHKIVEGLDVRANRVRVGIVLYNDGATAQVYLNDFNDKSELLQFIKILPYRGGGTNTGAALKFTREQVFTKERGSRKSQGVQQLAIVITDGESQDQVDTEAADLRRSGVNVYAVGIQNAKQSELIQIASYPHKKHVFIVDSFAKLNSLEQSLKKILCSNIIREAVSTRANTIKEGCVQTEEADIFFLIDHSGSIYPRDFSDMKKFMIEFLSPFRISPHHVRVGVVKYADSPNLEFDLTTYTDAKSLENAMEAIKQIGGGTQTGTALAFMEQHFQRATITRGHKVPEYLIVITDGKSADEVKIPAETLRAQGVTIYAIGVKNADDTELQEIAGSPQKTFFVNDFDALKPIKDDIITDICSPSACKDIPGDVIFLIDSSGSIDPVDFGKMKDFMKSVVAKSFIGQGQVHVGVMQFSTIQKVEFSLNQYFSQDEMIRAIDAMQQIGGGTHTGEAIREISQYFDPFRGGRPDLRQGLIVITDGEAQDEVKGPAEALRAKGVLIYAIGVVNANTTQLLEISGTQERVYNERNFDALQDLESQLALEICDPVRECKRTEVADIIFLVDGSTSITQAKFRSMLKFMESMVNETTVGEKLTRFGVILYSNEPNSVFTLNEYFSKKDVRNAIANLKSPYGDTYTGKALSYTLQFFDAAHGGRRAQHVPQILMVITDGDATDRNNLVGPSRALRDNMVDVISIGVEGANRTQLEIMAGGDTSKVLYVDNFDALETLYKNISLILCNTTKPVCEKQKADIVLLIDQSGSITQPNYSTMKTFTTELVKSFKISQELVRIGVAQFSDDPKKEFFLNELETEAAVNDHILSMTQVGGGTNIGKALAFIQEYFKTSTGSRTSSGISQNLVLITDGDSDDDVEEAAVKLRGLGVEVFAIGIGDVHDLELLQITGTPERLFTVKNFGSLEQIKQKVVKTICESKPVPSPGSCSVDIAMGFDITRRTGSQLTGGQTKLHNFLQEIADYVSTLQGLCCVGTAPIKTNIGFTVVGSDGRVIDNYEFKPYSDDIVKKVLANQLSEPTYFNTALLNTFKNKFTSESQISGVKVLVIFSDGLDEDVLKLEEESQRLYQAGIDALLIVSLEGVQHPEQLQMVEFGRGFGYKLPLSIGMQSVGSALLKQIDAVADRVCCKVMCKCSGHEGVRGGRGPAGTKGLPGPKGHPGFPGEEGMSGDRGPPGPSGPQGIQGCSGIRGQKGYRGHRGNRGDDGEPGLDGVNGEQGVTGTSGASGEKGNPGRPGIRGPSGEPGLHGQRGLRGNPGEPGLDNTVRGPKGDPGNQGVSGPAGEDGVPGESGIEGNNGPQGRRGQAGSAGPPGPAGDPGLIGSAGPSGPQGTRGDKGLPGTKGLIGLPGPQGGPGSMGDPGALGRRGRNGQKGQPGDPGEKGVPGVRGPRGMPGQDGRDGYGPPGLRGGKGDRGFPGYPGVPGEIGLKGIKGWPGSKGNVGRGGNTGGPGEPGAAGETGPTGHKGPRGPPGTRAMTECQLITYIRDNCACSQGQTVCPAYPTELVFALDMSDDVTNEAFEQMRSSLLSLIDDISIAESNCPTGARVAVVAYSAYTKYLIRFQDYRRKTHLVEAIKNIALERTANKRYLGSAMRYVGQNVLKRTRSGVRMRKVAVFLSNGQIEDISTVVTALMELRGLNVHPVVISLKNSPNVRRAMESDDTGYSLFKLLGRSQDLSTELRKVRNCAICFDPCRPARECVGIQEVPGPQAVDVDLAMIVDGSREIQADEYTGVQELLGSVVEQLAVSPQPARGDGQARVALVQQGGSLYTQEILKPKLEFGLQTFQDNSLMLKQVSGMQRRGSSLALGNTLQFALEEVLLKATRPRKRKALLAVVGAETSLWDQTKLHYFSLAAKCHGVAVFVVTVGDRFNRTQVEELASHPVEQHLVHLGRLNDEEQGYGSRFFRIFLSNLNSGMNPYPPASLKRKCDQLLAQGQGQGQGQVDVELRGQGEAELEEEEEEGQEEFQELARVPQVQTDLGQVDGTDAFSTGDGGVNIRYDNTVLTKTILNKDACSLKQDVGGCANYTMKWYFDSQQSECSRFWYGGCGGNSNRFETEEECELLCLGTRQ